MENTVMVTNMHGEQSYMSGQAEKYVGNIFAVYSRAEVGRLLLQKVTMTSEAFLHS